MFLQEGARDEPRAAGHEPQPLPAQLLPGRLGRAVRWGDRLLTRLGLRGALRRDCALAVVVACGSCGLFALSLTGPEKPAASDMISRHAGAIFGLLIAQALVLCLRRRTPVGCLYAVIAFQLAVMALLHPWDAIRTPSQFVAAYTVGSLLPTGTALTVVAVGVLVETAGYVAVHFPYGTGPAHPLRTLGELGTTPSLVGEQLVAAALIYGIAVLAGTAFAVQRRYVVLARLREREAWENHRAREAVAVGQERARMARELHDIAAHHLSGLVIQAAVLERMIDNDPAAAKQTATWIRGQGRETLDDLRLVVGVLRGSGRHTDDGESPADDRVPVPGLAALGHLVDSVRELGTPATLVRTGGDRALPPVADVTFYRVAQEALSNVRFHAPGAVTHVTLDHQAGETVLTVDNEAASPAAVRGRRAHSGFGLTGMRERADLIGARFEAGRTASGGWRVRLLLPVTAAETTPTGENE